MSRQRPYESFEKAYFKFIAFSEYSRNGLYKLISEITTCIIEDVDLALPTSYFLAYPELGGLWSGLCRLFGEQYGSLSKCYIPANNLTMALDWINYRIDEVRGDNIYANN